MQSFVSPWPCIPLMRATGSFLRRRQQLHPLHTPRHPCPIRSPFRAHATEQQKASDELHMRRALDLARKAFAENEVPIGAVLVDADGTLLGEGRNSVEGDGDVTQHAEIVALRNACKNRSNWRLSGATLYCTLEPCPMCLSALALARVSTIVYGAPDLRLGACGTWIDLTAEKHPFHEFESVRGSVLEQESAQLLRTFFRKRRLEGSRWKKTSEV